MPHNDSDDRAVRDDMLAEGEAGLYFIEAIALKLIEKDLLTVDEVIECLELAKSAKTTAAEEGQAPRISKRAAAVLTQVVNSISAVRSLRPPVKS